MTNLHMSIGTGAMIVIVVAFILVAFFGLGTIAKIIVTILFFVGILYFINYLRKN
jgi:hypothetical protein